MPSNFIQVGELRINLSAVATYASDGGSGVNVTWVSGKTTPMAIPPPLMDQLVANALRPVSTPAPVSAPAPTNAHGPAKANTDPNR